MAHVIRSASEVVQTKVDRGCSFGKRFIELLREAIELRESKMRGEAVDFVGEAERLKREASHNLRDRQMPDRTTMRMRRERMALDLSTAKLRAK